MRHYFAQTAVLVSLLLSSSMVFAHSGTGSIGGFLSGLAHPVFGWDHVVAMVAVGLWGAFPGRPAIWLLPIVFPLVMAVGGAIGVAGIALPAVETGIALSSLVLGLMVAFAIKPPMAIAAVLVGVFAIFHGHAHGTELPEAANPIAYAAGFVIATGSLHLLGIALGYLTRVKHGEYFIRGAGAMIALFGTAFLTGMA